MNAGVGGSYDIRRIVTICCCVHRARNFIRVEYIYMYMLRVYTYRLAKKVYTTYRNAQPANKNTNQKKDVYTVKTVIVYVKEQKRRKKNRSKSRLEKTSGAK